VAEGNGSRRGRIGGLDFKGKGGKKGEGAAAAAARGPLAKKDGILTFSFYRSHDYSFGFFSLVLRIRRSLWPMPPQVEENLAFVIV
jgi:hypothetical protein